MLGPILINQASESELRSKLNEAFGNRFRDRNRSTAYSVEVRDEDFQKVKVQLRALGLIQELKTQSQKGTRETRWTLTKHGDHVLTRVVAIPSAPKSQQTGT